MDSPAEGGIGAGQPVYKAFIFLNGTTTSTIREGLLVCCWLDTPGRSFGDFPGQIVFDDFPRLPPAMQTSTRYPA